MKKMFDTVNASLFIEDNVIAGYVRSEAIEMLGIEFVEEINMHTGWIFRTTKRRYVCDWPANLAFGFEENSLKTLSFSFLLEKIDSITELHLFQNEIIMQELGAPTEINERRIIYKYSWGEIVSQLDPRANSADIIISWGKQ